MNINLGKLKYTFINPPLLVGGMAKEYYGIRDSGKDIDFIASANDYNNLAKLYPKYVREVWGDFGVCIYEFEVWKTIVMYNYDELSKNAIEKDGYKIISLEKLLFMTALAMEKEKYHQDLELIVKKIKKQKYS